MAGLIDILLPSAASDVVAVYDQNFNQVFATARPIKATYDRKSKTMEHPVEDGSTITDDRVLLPTDIQLSLILRSEDFRSAYDEIEQLYLNGTLLTVQGRTKTFRNMLIEKMPHDEDPALFDVIALALSLHEVQFVTATFGKLPASKVKKPTNASTVDRGQLQTTPNNGSSTLYKLFF